MKDWKALHAHFLGAGTQEAGAFLLLRSGATSQGPRVLVERVIFPSSGALERQGADYLRPSGQFLSSVIGSAIEAKSGLGFIHSHPGSGHPPVLSSLDVQTTHEWNRSIGPMLDGPFCSLVWSPAGVTGIGFFNRSIAPLEVTKVEAIGDGRVEELSPHGASMTNAQELDDRQIRALTALGNDRLRRLDVGIVGAGGTGSPLAEILVRLGIRKLSIVDFDQIEESNLRRIVGSSVGDLGKGKAGVVKHHLDAIGLATRIDAIDGDVRTNAIVRDLIGMDVLFGATDSHSSRALLNQIAYQYWIPTIDVGVRIGTAKTGMISGMPVEVRTLLPDNGCMWCRKGILSSQAIYEENLPPNERNKLVVEGYVQGVTAQPSLAPLNFMAASLAALTMIRLYSGLAASPAVIFDGWENYVQMLDSKRDEQCICHTWRGRADSVEVSLPTN